MVRRRPLASSKNRGFDGQTDGEPGPRKKHCKKEQSADSISGTAGHAIALPGAPSCCSQEALRGPDPARAPASEEQV